MNEPHRRLPPLRLTIAAALALVAAGCSRGESEAEQNVAAAAEPVGTTVDIPETAEPAITAEPAPIENTAPTEEQLSQEAQMQEDAYATGMTSRLPAPGEQQAPVVTE